MEDKLVLSNRIPFTAALKLKKLTIKAFKTLKKFHLGRQISTYQFSQKQI